jgi:hypothetical protein
MKFIHELIHLISQFILFMDQKLHAYKWYSDYKSASSVERVEAFIKLDRPDPAEYADETGPVTWEHVVTEVSKVLAAHE